jgi:hypothetical protein
LAERTVEHLVGDQRSVGGWGPWKDHSAPVDYLATGLAMKALAEEHGRDVRGSLLAAVQHAWSAQLSDGLYPTHYIEEGSGWMLVGLCSALRLLDSEGA